VQFVIDHILFEIAFFAAVGYLLIGIDEILVDLLWLGRSVWHFLIDLRTAPQFSADCLPSSDVNTWFAVLIPAYDEASVIGRMLDNALAHYGGRNVHVFVGCYSCDPATIEVVGRYQGKGLSIVVLDRANSTTKGDCLNELYLATLKHEGRFDRKFCGYILHDAEDVVDRHEISVFAAFVQRYAMIQLPVIPLPNEQSRWVGGHYCDEFAESHGKTMIVRQMLGASLPSAGVGCMIRRDAIEVLAGNNKGRPFDENCATEDYECGLRLGIFPIRAWQGPDPEDSLDLGHRSCWLGSHGLGTRLGGKLDADARSHSDNFSRCEHRRLYGRHRCGPDDCRHMARGNAAHPVR